MMENTVHHKVILGLRDTLLIQFDEYPGMQLTLSYAEAVEAMLHGELRKLQSDRVAAQQNYGLAASEARQSFNRF